MRTRIILIALAALAAAPATAQARNTCGSAKYIYAGPPPSGPNCPNYSYYYAAPRPALPAGRQHAFDRAYDRALLYFRTHGVWPDGHDRTPWRRGQILPLAVAQTAPDADWRRAQLDAPKSGYRWLRVDDDYLLVGKASRLIAAIVGPAA